ncbi:MAG: class I SAM-dependent methyltransferase [Patescibacteria group bacterium]
MKRTDNFVKHTSQNPLQKLLINNFYNHLVSAVKDLQLETVLDVGCGEGFTLNRLSEEGIGKKLEGVDFQEKAIEIGKKLHPDLTLKQGDIYKLEYKNNSFDLVMATEVLEHLDDPKKGLKELIRVSRKYILLSVPNEPFFMGANFLRGKNLSRWGNDIEHIQHWTSSRFEEFVIGQGLKVIKKRHPFPWTMLLLSKI